MFDRFFLFLALALLSLSTLVAGCKDSPGEEGSEVKVTVNENGDTVAVQPGDDDPDNGEEPSAEEKELEKIAGEREQGRYRIRLDPQVGDRYSYQVARNESVTAGEITTRRSQTYDVDMDVVSSNDDGSLVLGLTYRRVRAEITSPAAAADSAGRPLVDSTGQLVLRDQTVRFDTKGNSKMPGGERYRAFIGRQALVTIDRKGNVIDVANVDPILNATLRELKVSADTINPKMLEAGKQGIRFEFGTLVSLVFFNLAPDSAIHAGSSWSRSDSLPVAGLPSLTTYSYTVKDISEKNGDPVAQIAGKLTTKPTLPKKSVENEMLSMKITGLSVSGSASHSLNLLDGFPLARTSTITSTMKGSGTMKAGPEKGKSSPITMKESTRTSIKQTGHRSGNG